MSSNNILLSVLALVACPAFEALLVAPPGAQLKRGDPKEPKPEKKLTDPITIMRGELCWGREKLVGHVACMEWLVEECTTKSFGTGLCNRVSNHVKEECIEEKDQEACHYAKLLGIDIDSDDDGVTDDKDAFPNDPKESKDTDGDGVGDNGDDHPNDAKCQKKPCPAPITTTAPPTTPAPASTRRKTEPAPAPAPTEKKEAPAPALPPALEEAPAPAPAVKENDAPAPAPAAAKETPAPNMETTSAPKNPSAYEDPNAQDGLQSQGFSGKKVVHVDGETAVSDWGKEYGHHKGSLPKKSSSTRLWQPHALTLAAGALTLACTI